MRNWNFLLYKGIIILVAISLFSAQGKAQNCFPGCNNLRLIFRSGGFTTSDENIRICPGQTTILKLDTSGCSGLNFTGLSFQWQFSQNGGTWSNTIPGNPPANRDSLLASDDGYYRLLINGSTCSTTVKDLRYNSTTYNDVQIAFFSLPNVSISPASATVCSNSTTRATLSATGADDYSWSPSTGLNTTTGATVTAKPVNTTTYVVTGTSSSTGCKSTDTIIVTVANPPTADFSFNTGVNNCASNREVQFTSTCASNCNGLTYDWDFGDNGASSDKKDPKRKFSSPNRTYDVTLTVTNSAGCKSSITKQVTIGAVPDAALFDPAPDPVAGDFSRCSSGGNEITIGNNSNTKSTNSSYTIEWGDGTSFTSSTFSSPINHIYPDQGFWNIRFTVTSTSGCTSTIVQRIYIGSNPAVGLTTQGNSIGLCVPFTRTFLIDTAKTNTNPPGTTYTVSYNDGSPNDVFTHPAPSTFTHTFNQSSCGATGGRTLNTFFVSIRAENPCGFSDATVEPITTATKPDANFGISPSTTICKGVDVSFIDSTLNGINVNNSGICNKNYNSYWIINQGQQGIDWNIISGSLGEPPSSSSSGIPGSKNFIADFITPGTYQITLIVRTINTTGSCNADTITKTICVQDPPVANFVANPLKGCSPLTITTDNTSTPTNFCGPITNRWIITKTGGDCIQDSTQNYRYISGTDSTSFEPVIRLNNQGTYNIRLGLSNACPEVFSPTQIFTVIRKPEVVLTAPDAVCTGTAINPSVTVKNCLDTVPERHFWTFQGASPSSSTSANPGTINFPANNGTTPVNYVIKDSVVNGCGSTVVQKQITINPLPTITGTLRVCVSNTTTLSGSGTAATTNPWISSNTAVATVNSSGVVSGVSQGTADITYTDNNGCKRTVTVTVNPNPIVSVSPSSTAICIGQGSATLTASGADTYSWSSNPGTFSSATNPITVSPSLSTIYTVTGTITATGCFSQVQATVNVNPLPTITGANNVCVGRTLQLIGALPAATPTAWTSSNTTAATVSNTGLVTGQSAGTTDITYTNNNGCKTTLTVTVNPNPSVSVSPATSAICIGQGTSTLTASGANTYSWSSSPGTFSSTNNSVSVSPSVTTTYTVNGTVTATGCSSQAQTTVTVNPLPTISGATSVCVGRNIQLTGSLTAATPTAWSSSSVTIATVDNTGLVTGVAPGSATITYINSNNCRTTFNVNVFPIPAISGSRNNPTACLASNGSITITGLVSTAQYTLTYTKEGVPQTPITVNNPASGSYIISGLSSGTYSDIIVTSNGCPSNALSFSLADPNAPATPVAASSGPICSGNTLNLTATTSETGTLSWQWSGPNGFSRTEQNPSIANAQVTASGTYSVTLTVNNCRSSAGTVTVVVNQTPAAPVVTNNGPVCTDSTLNLFASTSSTMPVSWNWTGPNGFTSSLQNPTRSPATSAMAGSYSAAATASYTSPALTCSSTGSTSVVINPTPNINATGISPSTCGGSDGSITITGMTAGSYQLRYIKNGVPVGPINITINSTGQHIINNLTAGTYDQIEVTLNSCPSNKFGPITLTSPTSPTLSIPSSNITVCEGQSTGNITFTSNPTNATIDWSNSNTSIGLGSSSTGSINSFTALNTTTIPQIATLTIRAALSGCTSAPQTMTITVNPRPKIADITEVICSEGSFTVTPSASVAGNIIPLNTTYTWTVADNSNVTGEAGNTTGATSISGNLTNTSNQQQIVLYTVTPKSGAAGNCDGPAFTVSVTVNPKPFIKDTTVTICSDGTYDIIPSNGGGNIVPSGTKYSWSSPTFSLANSITILSGATGTDLLSIAGQLRNNTTDQQWAEFIVTPKGVPGDCPGTPFKVRIIVNPRPTIQNITDAICSEGSFNITPSATLTGNIIPNGTTYTWTVGDNLSVTGESANSTGASSVSGNNLRNLTNVLQQVLYTVTPTSGVAGACPGAPFTITINVNPKPKIVDTVLTICSGTSFTYNPLNTPPSMLVPSGTTFTWSAPVVTGGLTGGQPGTDQLNISGTLSNPTANVQEAVYTVTPTSTTGNCVGPDFIVRVRVNPAPKVDFTPTSQTICSGDNTQPVTLSSPSSGVSIPWSAIPPFGITGVITGGTGTIPVQTLINNTPDPITVNYTATAQTTGAATCNGSPTTYSIIVNPTPVIADITDAICSDSFFVVTPTTAVVGNIIPVGTTYSWSVPQLSAPGSVLGANSGNSEFFIRDTLINITNVIQTVTYTVNPRSGAAGNCPGKPFKVTVTVYPTPVIPTLYDTICTGERFVVEPQNGSPTAAVIVPALTSYTWSAPSTPPGVGGAISGFKQPTITGILTNTTFIPETIEYMVTPFSGIAGSCEGTPFRVLVTVNPLSAISNNPLSQAVCTDNTTTPINWTSFTPNSSFEWRLVSSGSVTGFAPSGQGPTLPSMTLRNAGVDVDSVVYAVTSTASECAATATNYTIYVNPDAKAQFNAPVDTACWPFKIPITNVSPATANSDYRWYANDSLIGNGINFPGYTIQGPDQSITIKMVAISKYGCRADSVSKRFFTYKQPDASFNSSVDKDCGPLSVYFTNTSTFNSTFNYSWDFGNGIRSSQYQADSVFYVTNPNFGDTVYTITLKASNQCFTATATKQIVVQSKPLSRFLPDKTTGCSPLKVSFNNTSLGVGNSYIWDFGDGSPREARATRDTISHTYLVGVKTTFVVKLIAINPCGVDSSTFNLVVTPNPIKLDFAVLGTEQNGCAPHIVRFFNNTIGADLFRWDFGDGNILSTTKNVDTITHVFLSEGKYTVRLFASSICSDTTATEIIDVFSKPKPNFTATIFSGCIGDTVRFINQTTNGATSYLWRFGDGNTSVLVNPGHRYTNPGTYTVTLIAYKDNAPGVVCIDSFSTQVKIVDTLPINFDISATLGKCTPFKVTFTNTFLSYSLLEWDFGDGNKGTGNVVEHTYLQNGVYTVRLTIRTIGGCTYTAVKQITVAAPEGTVRVQTGFNCLNTDIRFEAVPVNTDSVFWNFGDGTSIITTNYVTYHSYKNPGTYYASAVFISKDGCRYNVPGNYEIKIDRVNAGFTIVQNEECGSTKVRFVDTSNVFFTKTAVEWRFGDGSTGSGQNITHTYASSGTYLVQQIVKSNSGCSDTVEIPINVFVRSLPNAEIVNAPIICTNTDIQFGSVVTSTDPVNFYKWTFSNGITSDKESLTVRFANAGTVNVRFIAGTIYSCYDTIISTLRVSQTPTVRAVPDVTICKGQSVNLNAFGALNYTWYPTDYLTNPNIANPVAKPDVTTPYTVKGITADGCFAYDTININVVQPFKITVMPGDSICIGESVRLLASGAYRYEWTPASTLNQANIPNPLATPVATTNYRVVGFDEFGCFRDTGFVLIGVGLYPTVNLGPDLTLSTGTMQKLTSAITNGPIQNWLWTPPTNLNCSTCPEPIAEIKKDVEYKVKVTTFFGCSGYDTLRIKVFCEESQVYVPNAFSPDGDGRNDVFMVRGKGIMQVKSMRIFNRWGDLVFEKTNIIPNDPSQGWDGRVRGMVIGPDVFAYVVEVVCDNGIPYFYKGNVTLLK